MRVGFTGTQNGMTDKQMSSMIELLRKLKTPISWLHHGVCIGADEQTATLAREIGYKLHGHPPLSTRKMSKIFSDVTEEPKEYLVRNHDIVDSVRVLIAAPATQHEMIRSGTWATWRYANSLDKPSILVLPDGTTKEYYF